MIDFHSHILPGVDDGSASVEESLKMLRASSRKGIEKIAAMPHFYAAEESPEEFLERRDASRRRLDAALEEGMPEIHAGAEVCYYTGISRTKELQRLTIGGSGVLLLEMPFARWPGRTVDEVISLAEGTGLTVLLAHIDRYLPAQAPEVWDTLEENGVLFQVNASFFLGGWGSRRRACRLLREGRVAVLGSDCHNTGSRPQNLDAAYGVIRKKFGRETVSEMTERADRLLVPRILSN